MAGIDIFKKHSKKQEEDNYKALFREYFASMCLFAEHYLGDYEMARDAVHDVFCRLWESAVCFDGIENKKGYLYTIVRNHCLDLIKRRNVRDRYAQNNVLVEEESETALEIEMLREEIYNLLDKAIAQLPARSGEIMRLKMQGCKNEEIAEKLNISLNTVNTLKTNAYKFLREMLQDKYLICCVLFFPDQV